MTTTFLVMASAILWMLLAFRGAVARAASEGPGIDDVVELLQTTATVLPKSAGLVAPGTNSPEATEWVDHTMGQMEKQWT
eukprot:CAMPEP_0179099298 /NCGR_PEP_ID=MMETSP0796-20121207/45804_1 /TAXON_ID=73915 /ORGANISM="Pyrodinium bahamense, Strain pbaha01" /LENGTH=79 /DNA_ID=CAMNT_0020797097 /DNA_START=38 /DNA_END=274 /DNA_ORIENTATION=+